MLTKSQLNFYIIIAIILLVASLLFANYTDFDIFLQNHFFNQETREWLIDADEPHARFFFYNLPKIFLGLCILASLAFIILGFKNKSQFCHTNRHKLTLILLGLALIPLLVGNIKKFTDIYCPNQIANYSGKYPHYRIFAKYDADFEKMRTEISPHGEILNGIKQRGQCFPAAHAVTVFAFMILFFALEKKSYRYISLFGAVSAGWVLGSYQMLKGAHFFSHNLVSCFACFLVAALIAKGYNKIITKYIKPDSKHRSF